MSERFRSPGFVRAISWVSGLILLAGVAAVLTVWIGSGSPEKSALVNNGETIPDELPVTAPPDVADVPAAARKVAADFIEGAVARKDLAKAWTLIHPTMKRDCACTREEWLTGDIPVQFFPAKGIETIRFGVNEISPGMIVLEVLLDPAKGHDLQPTAFYVGLKSTGKGDAQKWLVDYFAPMGSPPVPQEQ
jgi:hypothetical protein